MPATENSAWAKLGTDRTEVRSCSLKRPNESCDELVVGADDCMHPRKPATANHAKLYFAPMIVPLLPMETVLSVCHVIGFVVLCDCVVWIPLKEYAPSLILTIGYEPRIECEVHRIRVYR